jgi:hypothetical protein
MICRIIIVPAIPRLSSSKFMVSVIIILVKLVLIIIVAIMRFLAVPSSVVLLVPTLCSPVERLDAAAQYEGSVR